MTFVGQRKTRGYFSQKPFPVGLVTHWRQLRPKMLEPGAIGDWNGQSNRTMAHGFEETYRLSKLRTMVKEHSVFLRSFKSSFTVALPRNAQYTRKPNLFCLA